MLRIKFNQYEWFSLFFCELFIYVSKWVSFVMFSFLSQLLLLVAVSNEFNQISWFIFFLIRQILHQDRHGMMMMDLQQQSPVGICPHLCVIVAGLILVTESLRGVSDGMRAAIVVVDLRGIVEVINQIISKWGSRYKF